MCQNEMPASQLGARRVVKNGRGPVAQAIGKEVPASYAMQFVLNF